jgi:predicted RNA-binding protein with PUA-like domain
MGEGDLVLVYHTGSEKAVAGLARVARAHYPDPSQTDPAAVAVDLEPVRRAPTPVPLAAIRAEPACRELALVRIPRLSVMPVPEDAWVALSRRAGLSPGGGAGEREVQ